MTIEWWSTILIVFLMIRRPPRSTQSRSSAASDVYKRQELTSQYDIIDFELGVKITGAGFPVYKNKGARLQLSLIHISEPTRPY